MDPPFQIDERVYCEESGGVYEGIIRNAKLLQQDQWSFFVHYSGWNSRYDRWIGQEFILKQNRKRSAASTDERPRKRVTRNHEALPFTLKTVLVDECEWIGVRGWLHRLPATVPVQKLLSFYRKRNEGSDEFCETIAKLFQEALPKCLLYPQEYAQYEALENKNNLINIYGCEYLLRMAVRLPLPAEFAGLIHLMQKNKVSLFPVSLSTSENETGNYQLVSNKK